MNLLKKSKYGLMIYNRKDVWVGRSFDLYGEYSEAEVQVWADYLKPGNIVFDVGANTGSHTVAFSRLVGPTGSVFAFEPERTAFYALAGNVAINNLKNVYCYQQALGNENGSIRVPELDYDKTTNFGGVSLDADYSESPHYVVGMNKIDSISLPRLDLVKIDVEGMEKVVLEGGVENINKFKPVLYVENDRADKSEALIAFIKSLGYQIYSHTASLYNPNNFYENKDNVFVTPLEDGTYSQYVSVNLYCCHGEPTINPEKFGMKKVD